MDNLLLNSSSLTRLSQHHLNLLETCPRKFQHILLDQLSSPISPDYQDRTDWGSRFHLLMQQRELGLPIESLLEEDEQMAHSIQALIQAAPEILEFPSSSWRQAEHYRTVTVSGYILSVAYDLLIAEPNQARIFDWKTYLLPENKTKVAQSWQTRLYLYVLAETSSYLPQDISMTYWFVKLPTQPQSLSFSYDRAKHQKTRQNLVSLLDSLDQWLEDYQEKRKPFPQVPKGKGVCRFCTFASRCHRTGDTEEETINSELLTSVESIEEIAI